MLDFARLQNENVSKLGVITDDEWHICFHAEKQMTIALEKINSSSISLLFDYTKNTNARFSGEKNTIEDRFMSKRQVIAEQ